MAERPHPVPRSVVLVHGMWGCPEDWVWVREILEGRGVEVIVPDLPSHRSPEAGLLDDAEVVASAVRSASLTPVVAVGWSYGCDAVGIGAEGAARLVYVSSAPQPVQPGIRDGSLFDNSPDVIWDSVGRFAPPGGWWNDEGAEFSAEVRDHFERHPRRAVTRRTLTDPIPVAAWTHLPTTVLLGERDVFNGEEPWTRARGLVDDVRVVDCDHFVPFTLPGLVADVILEPVPARQGLDRATFPKNARGETYGSGAFVKAGEEPDLIAAIGEDHKTRGYVRKTDWESRARPKTLQEVEARAASGQAGRVGDKEVPLFAEDGVTVVGSFIIKGWGVRPSEMKRPREQEGSP